MRSSEATVKKTRPSQGATDNYLGNYSVVFIYLFPRILLDGNSVPIATANILKLISPL